MHSLIGVDETFIYQWRYWRRNSRKSSRNWYKTKWCWDCSNVTPRAGAESSRSRSHVTTIIQNFTLVSLTSTAIPHPAGLPFGAMVFSHPTHLTTYSTPHCLRSRKVFPAVGTICWSMRLIMIFIIILLSKDLSLLWSLFLLKIYASKVSHTGSSIYLRSSKSSGMDCYPTPPHKLCRKTKVRWPAR